MKFQPEVKKELTHIACGTALCTAVMWVLFAALHLVGVAPFDYRVILGGLAGTAVAVGNFAAMCATVQKAADEQDAARRRMRIQLSYNARMLVQAAWVVAAILAPCIHFLAGALPLLFPRVTIYYLQITGKFRPASPKAEEASAPEAAAPEEEADCGPVDKGGEI